MTYLLNPGFRLEYRLIPGEEKVYFVSSQDGTGKGLVLDDVAIYLMKVLEEYGRVNSVKPLELNALRRLEYEGVVTNAWSQKSKDVVSFQAESLQFWIQTSDRCNLACTYCYIPSLNSAKPRRIDLFSLLGKKLLELNGLKDVSIKLAGGEPLLCFDEWADEVITLKCSLAKAGICLTIRIITNLTFLNRKIIEYVKQNDVIVSVSLDGLEQFNDKNRIFPKSGKGSFYSVRKNLRILQENGIKPSVMITATSENHTGVTDLVKYLVEHDFTFRVSDAKGGHIRAKEFEIAFQDVKKVLSEAVKSGFPVSKRLVVSDLRTLSPQAQPCSMGTTAAAIYLDGSVYFCHTEFEDGEPLGSLDEADNLISIIRRGYVKHLGLSQECQSCEYRLVCAGGCPLYRENGKSPMCSSYKKIIPQIFELYEQEKCENRV
jgi:uncharacterized protein